MEFYLPQTLADWLPAISAMFTLALGLLFFAAPRTALRMILLKPQPDHPEALVVARGRIAGMYLGLGLSALLLQQPLVYLTLGACWALTGFGRLISILSDDGNTTYNWVLFASEVILALLALLPVFGIIG